MKMSSKKLLFLFGFLAMVFFAGLSHSAHAANVTWIGAGADTKWSTVGNWSTGATPGSGDVAIFSASSSKNVSIDTTINVAGFSMAAGYLGTITQASGSVMTIGSTGYYQTAGTFTGSNNASDTITVNGAFNLAAGTFTSTAGYLTISGTITLSGTFNGNSGWIVFNHGSVSQNIYCIGPINVQITGYLSGNTIINPGCTINLGTNPYTTGSFQNYGTIVVASGTWLTDAKPGAGWPALSDSQNYGTIDASHATGWLWNANNFTGYDGPNGFVNETGGTVLYGGTSMTFTGDLDVRNGSFPSNMNITFQHLTATQAVYCNGNQLGIVSVTGGSTGNLAVEPGCNINLGTNPSTVGSFANYGTITVASGTWTNTANTSVAWAGTGNSYNYGTINASGATGWMWNGGGAGPDGFINATSTAVVTYGGTSMTFTGDLDVRLGTFPTGLNINFNHVYTIQQSVWCNGNQFGIVSVTGSVGQDMYVNSGCTINLGTNPSTVGRFINYGTIKVASGTWANDTGNGYNGGGNTINYGTIDASGATGWMWSGGDDAQNGYISATSTAVLTYGGTSMTFTGDLDITTGTFPTGKNITFKHEYTHQQYVSCNGSPFGVVSVINSAGQDMYVNAGCTINLGTNPSTTGRFIIYGTVVVAGGTWTNDSGRGYNGGGDTINYGTIDASAATGWFWNQNNDVPDGLIQGSASSVVLYGGSLMTFSGNLNISSGTWPSGKNVNFVFHNGYSPTVTCGPNSLNTVTTSADGDNLNFGSSCLFTGDFNVNTGGVGNPGSPYTVTIYGNYNQNATAGVGGSNLTFSFAGTTTSTININSNSFNSNVDVSKTGIASTLLGTGLSAGTCTVNTGTFDMNNNNLTCSGALTVNSGGWLANYASYASTLTLGSSVTNNGVIFLDGSGPACTSPYPQFVNILSTASGSQRAWSGSGEFVIRSAYVKDQTASPAISVWNGTLVNDSGWSIPSGVGRPQLVENTTASWSGSGASSLTLPAFTYWPKPTDLVLVAVSAYGQTITAPTDNAGNTYRLATSTSFGAPSKSVALYYAQNVNTTSSFVVTLHGTGGGGSQLLSGAAYEFTGMAASSSFDKAGTNVDTSGNAVSLTSNNASGTSAQDELFFGAATIDNQSASVTSGSGWTSLPSVPNTGTKQGLYPEYQSVPNPVSLAATWTSNASTSYGSLVGIFDPPGYSATGYAASGTLDSAIFDTKSVSGAQLNSVTWYGTAPYGALVGFQFAVSNSANGPWSFIGPSGDGTQYFTGPAGSSIPLVSNVSAAGGYSLFNGYRYFRYRTILYSDSTRTYSPMVTGVNVNWSP